LALREEDEVLLLKILSIQLIFNLFLLINKKLWAIRP